MFFSKARVVILVCIFLSCLFTDILCSTTNISARQELSRSSNLFIRISLELTFSLCERLAMSHEASPKILKQFTESVVEELLTVYGHPNVDFRAFVTQKCSILHTVAKGHVGQAFVIGRINLFVNKAVYLLENYSSMVSSPLESCPEVLPIIRLGVKVYLLGSKYFDLASSLYYQHTLLIPSRSLSAHLDIRKMDTILKYYLLDATAPFLSPTVATLDPLFNQPCVDLGLALSRYLNYLNCYLSVLEELIDASDKINSIPVFFDDMKEVGDHQFSKDTELLRNICPLRDTVIVELQELMKNPLLTIDQPSIKSTVSQTFDNHLHLIILSSFRYYTPDFVMNCKNLSLSDRTSTFSDPLKECIIQDILDGHFKPTNVKDSNFLSVVDVLMIFKEQLNCFRNSDEFMKSDKKNDPLVKSLFSFVDLLDAYDSILKSDLLNNGMDISEGNFAELAYLPSKIENPSIMIKQLVSPTIEKNICAILTCYLNSLEEYFIHEKENSPLNSLFITFRSKATYFRTVFRTTILNTLTDDRFFYNDVNCYFGKELVIKGFMSDCTSTDLVESFCFISNNTISQLVARYYERQYKSIEEISQAFNEIGNNFGDLCDYYANVSASSVILPMVSPQILSQLGRNGVMHKTNKILKNIAAIETMSINELTVRFKDQTQSQALASVDMAHSAVDKHYSRSVTNLRYLVNFVGWHQKYHSYFPKIFKKSIDIEILPQITKAFSEYSPDVICKSDPIWKEYISDLSDIVKGRSDLNIQVLLECISSEKSTALFVQEGIPLIEKRLLDKQLRAENERNLAFTKPHLVDITSLLDLKEKEGKSEDISDKSLIGYLEITMDVLDLLGAN